ncbi:hypothetical protein JCM30394_29900 [Deferrisoma palaeochoriense]
MDLLTCKAARIKNQAATGYHFVPRNAAGPDYNGAMDCRCDRGRPYDGRKLDGSPKATGNIGKACAGAPKGGKLFRLGFRVV